MISKMYCSYVMVITFHTRLTILLSFVAITVIENMTYIVHYTSLLHCLHITLLILLQFLIGLFREMMDGGKPNVVQSLD